MKGKNIHIVPSGDVWKVKQDGCKRSSGNFPTQKQAINRGIDLAIKGGKELAIHGLDGKIRQKNSYGNDPHPPKG